MRSYTIMDTAGEIHNVEANTHGLQEVSAMMEFWEGHDLVFALPVSRIAWIKIRQAVAV